MGYKMGVVGLAIPCIFYIVLVFIMESVRMATSLETIVGLKPNVNAYTPLLECVVNSIRSIQEKSYEGSQKGEIFIEVNKGPMQSNLALNTGENPKDCIIGFNIIDNGVGFTEAKTAAYDEPFTDNNFMNGGKGYGRFTTLKVFDTVKIESIFSDQGRKMKRDFYLRFKPNRINNRAIISDEKISNAPNGSDDKTIIRLSGINPHFINDFDLTAKTIGKRIFEHLLPYFLYEKGCPIISISDSKKDPIELNSFLHTSTGEAWLIEEQSISIKGEKLNVSLIGIHGAYKEGTEIILTAHKRSVTNTPITKYIPEFNSTFITKKDKNGIEKEVTFYIKAYVSGNYLDEQVNFQRENFNFPEKGEGSIFITKEEIEIKVANIIKYKFQEEYNRKFNEKMQGIKKTVYSEMPYFSKILKYVSKEDLPLTKDKKIIAKKLYEAQFALEMEMREQANRILGNEELNSEDFESYSTKVSDLNADALARYILGRANTIKILKKYLKINHATDNHEKEKTLHSLIYPVNKTSEELENPYSNHNLWLLNENLVFSQYVVSDKKIFNDSGDRVDLAIFQNETVFRNDNTSSTPVFVYEFKRPGENLENKDHIAQLISYILRIHKKELNRDFNNRPIEIAETTSIYGYLVCDLVDKIVELAEVHNFVETPDGKGFYCYLNSCNAYIEILSWDKVVEAAEKRHQAFFKKLGIE